MGVSDYGRGKGVGMEGELTEEYSGNDYDSFL